MPLEYSWPKRWNSRSAPVRSTRTEMPGNFCSNARATFSASGKSTDVYQTTMPSFCAAAMRSGVIAVGGGAAARTGVANRVPAAALAAVACSTSRLVNPRFMAILLLVFSGRQRAAAFRRQVQPNRATTGKILAGRGDDTKLRAAIELDQI